MKGGIPLSSQGTIIARVFTSNARIPLRGAAVVFYRTDASGVRELLGLRLTNYDGMTDPLTVETPDLDSADISSAGKAPYAQLDVFTDLNGYDRVLVRGAQIFTGIQTLQDVQLIPTALLPELYDRTEVIDTPAQTL